MSMDKSGDLASPSIPSVCYKVVSNGYGCRKDRVHRTSADWLRLDKDECSSFHTCPPHDIDPINYYQYCDPNTTTVNEFSLFTPERNYLDRCGTTTTDKAYAKDLTDKSILVVVFWVPFDKPPQLPFTPLRVIMPDRAALLWRDLLRIIHNVVDFEDFVLVLVILTKPGHELDEANFYQLLSAFHSSCLAVPYHDEQSRRSIATLVETLSYSRKTPGALGICKHGFAQLLNADFLRSFGRDCYPFTDNNYLFLENERSDLKTGKGLSLESLLCLSSTSTDVVLSTISWLPRFKAFPLEFLKSKVVGLYLCSTGEHMEKLSKVYRDCSLTSDDFVIVLIYQPYTADEDLDAFQERMNKKLSELGIREWFILYFDDKVSRKIWMLCDKIFQDFLIMVGPNNSCVERDGFEMIRHYSPWFGFKELFPFTRERIYDIIMNKLNLRFFLGSAKLTDVQGNVMSLSDVEKKRNILLHLCHGSSQDHILEHLFTWYEELKQTTLDFELIFVCLNKDHKSCFGADTPKMPWPVAHRSQADSKSVRTIFCEVAGFPLNRLIAIRDGKAVSVYAEFKIMRFWKIFKTAVFPDRDTLREEVAMQFRDRHLSDCLSYFDAFGLT